MERAVGFMAALHKDLTGPDAAISFQGEVPFRSGDSIIGDFTIVISKRRWTRPEKSHMPPGAQLISRPVAAARFGFFNSCALSQYVVLPVKDAPPSKHEALWYLVNSHLDWDDARILKELKDAGARYTPDQRDLFVKSLPIGALEILLGKIKIERIQFQTAPEPPRLEGVGADINWRVDVEAKAPKDNKRRYWLTFDPFDGSLQQIGRPSFPAD